MKTWRPDRTRRTRHEYLRIITTLPSYVNKNATITIMSTSNPSIVIVHDVIDAYGGAERVVEALLDAFPKADLFTSRATQNPQTKTLRERIVGTTFMQKLPWLPVVNKIYTPLYPLAFESLGLRSYDIVISSTAHFAKGVLTTPDQLHVCYCHTPPRFLYGYPSQSSIRNTRLGKLLLSKIDHKLREYDYICAQRPDVFISNSLTVSKRIQKFYNRRSVVIHPPAGLVVNNNKPFDNKEKNYFLSVSRLVPYKNIDTLVKTFNTRTEKLIIVGNGPELDSLRKLAGTNIEFREFVSDKDLFALYANARAFLFASVDEDFGITPVEAMSTGVPIIAINSGGVSETVTHETGVFYEENTIDSLSHALQKFMDTEDTFNRENIKKYAQKFNRERFISQMRAEVKSAFTRIVSQ